MEKVKDTIYRQDAIDALEKMSANYGAEGRRECHPHIEECKWELRMLPSAQPERKKGKWIEDGYNHYKAVCSECGEPCATYVMDAPRDRFCKWCGADMRTRETDCDYERAVEQLERDILYEPTFNQDDGSM